MRDDIRQRIETITSRNGYAVFPRRVVIIEEAGEIHEQPERTLAIIQDVSGECGVMINCHPGPTEQSLRRSTVAVLGNTYDVHDPGSGKPIRVSTTEQPPDKD